MGMSCSTSTCTTSPKGPNLIALPFEIEPIDKDSVREPIMPLPIRSTCDQLRHQRKDIQAIRCDLTETVLLPAKSISQELSAIVTQLPSVPVQPILHRERAPRLIGSLGHHRWGRPKAPRLSLDE
jgi:hypothetical protein